MLAALVLAACGGAASGGPSASPTPPANTVLVTRANNQGTLAARVGDHIQIALGLEFNWKLDAPDGVVLAAPVQNYLLVRGTQAIWLAKSAGRSAINASGGVSCASAQPCPLLLAVFNATVEVSP